MISPKSQILPNHCDCRPRILIVDDNEFNLMPLRLIIRDFFIDQDLLENGFRVKSQKSSVPHMAESIGAP